MGGLTTVSASVIIAGKWTSRPLTLYLLPSEAVFFMPEFKRTIADVISYQQPQTWELLTVRYPAIRSQLRQTARPIAGLEASERLQREPMRDELAKAM